MMTRKMCKVEDHSKEKTVPTMKEPLKFCSDCQTADTPLWRSGPDGPKSLCNACGIRYSKRRRMEFKRVEERKPAVVSYKVESKTAVEMYEMKRMQRDKQEKMLRVLLSRRREFKGRWQTWLTATSGGGGYTEEVAEAARHLLSLSSGVSLHS